MRILKLWFLVRWCWSLHQRHQPKLTASELNTWSFLHLHIHPLPLACCHCFTTASWNPEPRQNAAEQASWMISKSNSWASLWRGNLQTLSLGNGLRDLFRRTKRLWHLVTRKLLENSLSLVLSIGCSMSCCPTEHDNHQKHLHKYIISSSSRPDVGRYTWWKPHPKRRK